MSRNVQPCDASEINANTGTGHDRLAQRLRGAGRVAVDDAPISFVSRPTAVINTAIPIEEHLAHDTAKDIELLAPITDAVLNITKNARKVAAKIMDFRTPKVIPTASKKGPPATRDKTPSRKIKPKGEIAPSHGSPVLNQRLSLSPPMLSSTPDANHSISKNTQDHVEGDRGFSGLTENQSPVQSSSNVVAATPREMTGTAQMEVQQDGTAQMEVQQDVSQRDTDHEQLSNQSGRKRKVEEVDIQVPVQMSPEKKQKKKLRGLLRELGPGASRFIIGAPNFATPARPRPRLSSIPTTGRRVSRRIGGVIFRNTVERKSRAEDISRSKALSTKAVSTEDCNRPERSSSKSNAKHNKRCITCSGLKAWNRWHATDSGAWRCHRCHKECISRGGGVAGNKGSLAMNPSRKRRGRIAHQLSDEELLLVLIRRRQGVTFNDIATELQKWKTGQSVKAYLNKAPVQEAATRLSQRVEEAVSDKSMPHTRQVRERKRGTREVTKHTSLESKRERRRSTRRCVVEPAGIIPLGGDDLDVLSS